MTLLLMAAAATAAALGTQVAALLLVAAAAFAAASTTLTAAATWTAALGAVTLWLSGGRRRLALPIVAAASALAAGAAPNAAAVLGLWVGGSLALLVGVDAIRTPAGRRWGVAFAAADVPLVLAVAAGSVHGFEGWPSGAHAFAAVALAVCAAAKAALVRAPAAPDEMGVLLVIRTQSVVAALLAAGAAPHGILQLLVVAGALAFASVGHLADAPVVDLVQEVALLTVAASAAALGWGPKGWVWGVLGAGTLIHYLRLSTRRGALSSVSALVIRGGVVGLPWLPVVLAELEGAVKARPWAAAVLAVGLTYGLASRIRGVPRTRLRRTPRWSELAPLVLFAVAAFAASIWAPLLANPHPPGGVRIEWFPGWAAAVIVAACAAGFFFPSLVRAPARPVQEAQVKLPAVPGRAVAERPGVLEAFAVVLVVAAAAMWIVGAIRGFL